MTARLDWSRLHSKILRSSVWSEEPMVRLVWVCALADSDTRGIFFGDEEALSRAWNLKVDDIERSLARLCAPDPRSATKENEGRRIERLGPNQWKVLNKTLYNPSGEPVGSSTPRVQAFRERQKQDDPNASETHSVETNETVETGNGSNGGNALEERRGEESREEKKGVRRSAPFTPPTVDEVRKHAEGLGYVGFDAELFWAHHDTRGWKPKGSTSQMTSWKSAVVTWHKNKGNFSREPHPAKQENAGGNGSPGLELKNGRYRLPSGWWASEDGSSVERNFETFHRRPGQVNGKRVLRYIFDDPEGGSFYVGGISITTGYNERVREAERQILKGHPRFLELFPEAKP